jgi:hypothetical protein
MTAEGSRREGYEAPALELLGTLEELTLGAHAVLPDGVDSTGLCTQDLQTCGS